AEYWKSQPRKLCEFCKCWITDNKPSIEFHERGKKHKENVQRRIEEVINSVSRAILSPNIPITVIYILKLLTLCYTQVQKKGREAVKVQKQLQNDLAAIEEAALKAYQKDMNIQPSVQNSEASREPKDTPVNEACSKGATTEASQWESPPCLSSPADKTPSEKENSATESEKEIKKSVKTEEKFKERSTPKITFRSALGSGNEIAFKKRKLNPDKKRNVRQTNPNKTE
ncbi:WW domain-binding protein 4, partial [Acropora cervicornis]